VKDSFRKEWGVKSDSSVLKTITMPSSDIIEQALDQYQTVLRKPAYTLWVVDYSGSMSGKGKRDEHVDVVITRLDMRGACLIGVNLSGILCEVKGYN